MKKTLASRKRLSDFAYNIYSQHGEDGILEQIFKIIGVEHKSAIEFGAWDGLFLSNSLYFWRHLGWRAILVECDSGKYEELKTNTQNYDCVCINAFVGYGQSNNMDNILKKNKLSYRHDLMVIDIDSDDYYVWEAMKKTRPRVVVCEYNCTIPPHLDIKQEKGYFFGSGIKPLVELATKKGYILVTLTKTNAIFVLKEEAGKFKDYETNLINLFDLNWLNYAISDYRGRHFLTRRPIWGFAGFGGVKIIGQVFLPKNKFNELVDAKLFSFYSKYKELFKKQETTSIKPDLNFRDESANVLKNLDFKKHLIFSGFNIDNVSKKTKVNGNFFVIDLNSKDASRKIKLALSEAKKNINNKIKFGIVLYSLNSVGKNVALRELVKEIRLVGKEKLLLVNKNYLFFVYE